MYNKDQNIDRLIQGIKSITTNRCSLSNDDIKLLRDVVDLLEEVKLEDSRQTQTIMIAKAIGQLARFFHDDIRNFFDGLM